MRQQEAVPVKMMAGGFFSQERTRRKWKVKGLFKDLFFKKK